MGAPRVYSGTVVRITDADTVVCDLRLGFHVTVRLACRLLGINAIELSRPGGPEARDHLASLLPVGVDVQITSVSVDKYAGRFTGRIELPDGRDAATVMVEDGFAARWNGRGARPVPVWPTPDPAA